MHFAGYQKFPDCLQRPGLWLELRKFSYFLILIFVLNELQCKNEDFARGVNRTKLPDNLHKFP